MGKTGKPKPRIAILEDHDDTREMLRVGLETDFSTVVYQNAGELLSALDEEKFSGIITDIMLPGLDGFGFIKSIRSDSRFAGLCVVAVTALAMATDRDKGITAGFTDYLVKPITPDDIAAVLWKCLKSSEGELPAA